MKMKGLAWARRETLDERYLASQSVREGIGRLFCFGQACNRVGGRLYLRAKENRGPSGEIVGITNVAD